MEKHTVIGADMLANLQMYEDEPADESGVPDLPLAP